MKKSTKNTHIEAHQSIKMVLVILGVIFFSVFFIGTVSALEIDNKLTYSKNDLKVDFDNSFIGLFKTSHIGEAELKSHKKVDEILIFGYGKEEVVMYYDFNFSELYENGLGDVTFTNKRTDQEIQKNYSFVYWGNEIRERNLYGEDCNQNVNGTTSCKNVIIGKENYDWEGWLPYNSKDIPSKNIRIGLKTYVAKNDYIDGVWIIAGKKVQKHAEWTVSLNSQLISYFKLDGIYGNNTVIDSTGNMSGTTNNGATRGATGIINKSFNFTASENDNVAFGEKLFNFTGTQPFTISLWFKLESDCDCALVSNDDGSNGNWNFKRRSDDRIGFEMNGAGELLGVAGYIPVTSEFYHVVLVMGTDNESIFVNGTHDNSTGFRTSTGTGVTDTNGVIGATPAGANYFNGPIDEVVIWNRSLSPSEVSDLYNDGIGITYRGVFTPTITLNSPINAFNTTNQTIDFNGTVVDSDGIVNVTLFIDGVKNETNSSGINNTNYLFTKTLGDGDHNWTYESCDGVDGCSTVTTRTFSVDTIYPQINISYPTNGQNFPYLVNLNNITLNITITDTNLDTCWYEYNLTNTTFTCSSGVSSENNLTINNESIIIVWANDTSGQSNSSISDWSYDLFDFNNYTFDATITESSSTTFIGNFQTGTAISSTFLEYNNTNNSVSINSLGGNRYTLTSTITTPPVFLNTNITWFFWVNDVNATSQNQTVQNIKLDNCSSYSNYIVNYTLVDELTQIEINNTNSSIESLINLKTISGEDIAQLNETFTGDSTPSICSEIPLNETGLRLWEQSRYGSDDYVFEQHNTQNATMTSLPTEIILRDLPSISATTFRITYKSETFLAVPDAVINIQRKYVGEGVFKSIESPITDANGEVSASLDLDAVIYRIIVSENGITLATFENPAIACDNILTGDCTVVINEKQTINLIDNYDGVNNFNFGLTQNNRTITLTFEIPSGESKSVNLFVNQSTILGNETSCDQTLLATSGQIQCVIDDTLGDVFTNIEVSSDNVLITTASTIIFEDRSQYFGTDNIVLSFFLVLSLILLFISDPIAVLIGIIIGLISSSLMLFLNSGSIFGTTSVLMYLIVIVVIIIIKISVRQQR